LNSPPRFSIVMPTYQRRDTVVRTVGALERQSRRDFEAIIVVDGSTDGTAAALRELRVTFPLTVLERSNQGGAAARNAGVTVATGELLVFLDDDMEADPQMLAEHDRSHAKGAEMVLGHLPLHPDSPTTLLSQGVGRWAERRRDHLSTCPTDVPAQELLTGQMSISRATFEQIGRFDVSFTRDGLYGGEDIDFGYRVRKAGLRVVFNVDAVSYQLYEVDPALYTHRTRQAGRAAEELRAKHHELTQDFSAGRVFTTRRSRIFFGALSLAPAALSWPLRALACHRVRNGRLDTRTYKLFFALQTMEYRRGIRQAQRELQAGSAVVLAYHAIADLRGDPVLAEYGVPPARFAEHLDALARRGRRFVTLEAALRFLDGEQTLPARGVLVTFDDTYTDLLSAGCPVLRERGIPAVAFAVAGRIGGTNDWDRPVGARALSLLDEEGLHAIAACGVTIGSHGLTHRRLVGLDPVELEEEVRGSAAQLVSIGLPRPVAFSYPYGVVSVESAAAVRKAGYAAAFTVHPGVVRKGANRYALPRVEVLASDTPRMLALKLATAAWPDPWRRAALRLGRAARAGSPL
jgi:glycosyltransferase involved in cell wall biosynthesis/peptidoglycan/xylan/chitin deacetylase (PgdA/CDA1 family)